MLITLLPQSAKAGGDPVYYPLNRIDNPAYRARNFDVAVQVAHPFGELADVVDSGAGYQLGYTLRNFFHTRADFGITHSFTAFKVSGDDAGMTFQTRMGAGPVMRFRLARSFTIAPAFDIGPIFTYMETERGSQSETNTGINPSVFPNISFLLLSSDYRFRITVGYLSFFEDDRQFGMVTGGIGLSYLY